MTGTTAARYGSLSPTRGKQVVDGLLENAAEQLTPEMAVFTEEEKQEFLACAGTFRRLLSKLESGGRAK